MPINTFQTVANPVDPNARLQQILGAWKQFPGRAPNGTGETGLNSNDAQGYSDLLNERTEGVNLLNAQQGKSPLQVRMGRALGGMQPSLGNDPNWWYKAAGAGPFGPTSDDIKKAGIS